MARRSGAEEPPLYCEAAMPAPLDKTFTYSLPRDIGGLVRPGCRIVAPLRGRRPVGVVVATHSAASAYAVRPVLRLLDEEPALTPALLALGRWIADYYCAPIGEVFRAMLPPSGAARAVKKTVSLTPAGAAAAARFLRAAGADDPHVRILRALERRPLTLPYLKQKYAGAGEALRSLEKRGLARIESRIAEGGPARSRSPLRTEEDAGADAPPQTTAAEQPRIRLNGAQQKAFEAVAAALRAGQFRAFLLHGVTGSGKTEVYLRAIEECLALGRSALLLVPEIALTPAVAAQFAARFGDNAAILHSAFSDARRAAQWSGIRSGRVRVVIGTRSGVFAPLADLGLVIVDEEHESGYKQEETPRYHGRDVAVVRAREAGAAVVLGSATPSLESRRNVDAGKYAALRLPDRVRSRPLPAVTIVDMRREFVETRQNKLFSRALADAVNARLQAGEQAMLLLNRRGFSSYAMCRACGYRVECANCSVTLTFHKRERRLLCHYCGFAAPPPAACPLCESEYIQFQGSGAEKVEEQLRSDFPGARIARLDRDAVRGRGRYEAILNDFRQGNCDLLVGTQMIAKGHDIPNVTLVGVVNTDVGLGVPDFRAAERTFQLLTQAAGRAGRGGKPGRVILQTMNPEHYAVALAARQDYDAFYKRESSFRSSMRYPPFAVLAAMIVRSRKPEEALALSGRLARRLAPALAGVRMMGPAAAPVVKLRAEYRYQFLLKSRSRKAIAVVLKRAREFALEQDWPQTALAIDVDPMSLI